MKTITRSRARTSISYLSERGVSLVEFMVASTIGLVLIAGAASLMLSALRGEEFKRDLDLMQENFRYGSNVIQRVLRQGTSFEAPGEKGRIKVALAQGAGSHDCMGTVNSQYNAFYISDGQLFCERAAGSHGAQALAADFGGDLLVEYGFTVDENGIVEYREAVVGDDWSVPTSARITMSSSNGQSVSFVATMRQKVVNNASTSNSTPGNSPPGPSPDPGDEEAQPGDPGGENDGPGSGGEPGSEVETPEDGDPQTGGENNPCQNVWMVTAQNKNTVVSMVGGNCIEKAENNWECKVTAINGTVTSVAGVKSSKGVQVVQDCSATRDPIVYL